MNTETQDALSDLHAKLMHAQDEVTRLQRLVDNFDPSERDIEDAWDAMLDEHYSFGSVGGPFAGMSPSRVLKECSPTDYRCGLVDYQDDLSRDGYPDMTDEEGMTLEEREDELEEAQDVVDDLEAQIAELEEGR